jgi:SAM-dependent methyltransferase
LTDYAAIFDYEAQPKETAQACNLCGSYYRHFKGDLKNYGRSRDRYGYEVCVAECQACHLNFFAERMTREAYARFYETAYRPLVSAFHGREINAQTIQPEQREYAARLRRVLHPWNRDGMRTLLDIGGSTGVVAQFLSDTMGVSATVLDPSKAELNEAEWGDVETVQGLLEDFNAADRFDLITLCQTADHLLDLMGSLKKIKSILSPDGLFWSDIVDFNVTREVKIDHPFNLTERTYRQFLDKAGFKLLQINMAPDGKHIGFLCK